MSIPSILATMSFVGLSYGALVLLAGIVSDDPRKGEDYRGTGGLLVIINLTVFVGSIVWAFH